MPAYVVGDIHITDPAAYRAHVPVALATIARFGGHVIAGGGKIELLEGGPMPERSSSSNSRTPRPRAAGTGRTNIRPR